MAMVDGGAKYIDAYGVCDNKCKVPVVSRDEIESEYFNKRKIFFHDVGEAFATSKAVGSVSVNLSKICKERGITLTEAPRIIPTCYTSGIVLSVGNVTTATAAINFHSVNGALNYLAFGIMVIVQ